MNVHGLSLQWGIRSVANLDAISPKSFCGVLGIVEKVWDPFKAVHSGVQADAS